MTNARNIDDRQGVASVEAAPDSSTVEVVPLIAEHLTIDKRMVETGSGVRLHKRVLVETVKVEQPLEREHVEIERVRIDRPISERVAIRYDGDTMIVPVIEERLVSRVELVLVEEIHVKRRTTLHHESKDVALRREEISIERFESDDEPAETSRFSNKNGPG